jgi:hypothetical protein
MLYDPGWRVTEFGATDDRGRWLVRFPNKGLNPNHVTVSNSGQYLIVSRIDDGSNRGDDFMTHAGTWAVPIASRNPALTRAVKLAEGSQHSDVCTNWSGHDYFIYADFDATSRSAGLVWYCPIENPNDRTTVLNTYGPDHAKQNNAFHFSGCGPDGWVLVSAYGLQPGPGKRFAWWDNRIFAVELGGRKRILHVADHDSHYDGDYWSEPHACWSRDGSTVVYAEKDPDDVINCYAVHLPELPE